MNKIFIYTVIIPAILGVSALVLETYFLKNFNGSQKLVVEDEKYPQNKKLTIITKEENASSSETFKKVTFTTSTQQVVSDKTINVNTQKTIEPSIVITPTYLPKNINSHDINDKPFMGLSFKISPDGNFSGNPIYPKIEITNSNIPDIKNNPFNSNLKAGDDSCFLKGTYGPVYRGITANDGNYYLADCAKDEIFINIPIKSLKNNTSYNIDLTATKQDGVSKIFKYSFTYIENSDTFCSMDKKYHYQNSCQCPDNYYLKYFSTEQTDKQYQCSN